jgi:polar amino acid transport system permease protein
MNAFTIFHVDWATYLPDLARGTLTAIEYTAVSFVGAVIFGFVLATLRMSPARTIRYLSQAYTELLKNMPLLTPIFVIYFGLSSIGFTLSAFEAGCLSLIAFYAAYLSEIFRGALQGVHDDQREAAQAVGLDGRAMLFYVVLPQAARLALPATGTMLVDMVKGTSLLITISGGELMTEGQLITSDTFRALEVYLVIGAIYFCLCYPLSMGVLILEKAIRRGTPLGLRRRRLWRLVDKTVPATAHAD